MSMINFYANIGQERISCYSTTSVISDRKILFLHGAGESDKKRLIGISRWFSDRGIESVGFDFSGHGDSTRNTVGSIKKRVSESAHVINTFFPSDKKIIICAFSMSGQVTLQLLKQFGARISQCFLCAPAIYHKDALDTPFGPDFSHIIRKQGSYKEHDLNNLLDSFEGDICIIMGSNDNVIPADIPDIISRHHTLGKNQKIILDNAPHMLAAWSMESSHNMNMLCGSIFYHILT